MPKVKETKIKKKVPKNVQTQKKGTICKLMKLKLHQLLDESEITELHEVFNKKEGRKMNKAELRTALEEYGGLKYSDDAFETIFKQMNSSW